MNASLIIPENNFSGYLSRGMTYQEYKQNLTEQLQHLQQDQTKDPKMLEYLLLNQQRMKRVEKTFSPTEHLLSLLSQLPEKTFWLVISEPWCGDAAQSLPVLAALAQASAGKIDLRIVHRDQNLALMDAFMFRGTRAIPRLIQLNLDQQVTGTWGPRPKEAQLLVQRLKHDPATAVTYGQHLHKWYALDKQLSIQSELTDLLQSALISCQECLI
jgi:hypothetical protein